jgi:hypothetical protein
LAIPSLIGALISKKLIKKYFGITDDMDEVWLSKQRTLYFKSFCFFEYFSYSFMQQ